MFRLNENLFIDTSFIMLRKIILNKIYNLILYYKTSKK